ncbi:hypothetical protein ACX9MO_14540 [Pseudooceanicola sp. 502str34]|uniref:hypothetical protein n=1 Tax=Maritimibacter alkaliphilus TaxID=404236 RepID=UPI001C938D02|nr:hypothetical protein [Maritimibacter alkaliphilus]MBY6089151.1 hypothetical protein [Maritimibacter alkaliphilus]
MSPTRLVLPLLPALLLWAGPAAACRMELAGARCVTADSANVAPGFSESSAGQAGGGTREALPQVRSIAGGARLVPAVPRPYNTPQRPTGARGPVLAPGSTLPDQYMILLNTERYGLPAPQDGWAYFRVEGEVYRVMIHSREVLERVTDQTNAAF